MASGNGAANFILLQVMTSAQSQLVEQTARLQALDEYEVLALPSDAALSEIARLAAQITNAPVALICMLVKDRLRVVARFGTDVTELRRESLPCETTLAGDGVYQMPDARRDAGFAPGGISVGDRRYRFYAGAPIITPSGIPIGCLAVLDAAPRKLAAAQIESLDSLAQMIVTRLELTLRMRQMDRAGRARQRVETALTVERNFVSAVLDTAGALVVVYDTAGRIVRFNRACEITSGYSSAELVGRYAWERLIPEEDVAGYIETFERIRLGEFPATFENHWITADGARRRIAWNATALLDSNAQVAFVIATGIDVTVQRLSEEVVRESESRYRQLIEGSLGLVATHDLHGVLTSMNTHGAHVLGRTVNQVVGHSLAEFIERERQDEFSGYMDEINSEGEAQGLMHLCHTSGEIRVLAYRNRLIESPGRAPYVLAFGVDITGQVRAEEQLHALIRQSNSVLESVGDGIYGIDLQGNCTVINPAAAQMLGYKPDELLGRNIHDVVHHSRPDGSPYPSSECHICRTLDQLEAVRISNEVFFRKDGSSFPVEYVAKPQIDTAEPSEARALAASGLAEVQRGPAAATPENRSGRPVGVVVAFTDISERNALDRMKDEFISTVSHELRTPLTSLRAALGLVAGGALARRPEKLHQMMEIAIGNTDRLVSLVNDILDLERIGSGKAELHASTFRIGDLLERAVTLQEAAASRANVRFTVDAGDVEVYADPDRILQTITNLVSNAIKFSPPPSAVPSEVSLRAMNVGADEALIEVEDRGRGIPADKLQQIFERFKQVDASDSRTKGGTGLGLAICSSIIAQHGGHIWATSKLGEGATFHFSLPTRPPENLL